MANRHFDPLPPHALTPNEQGTFLRHLAHLGVSKVPRVSGGDIELSWIEGTSLDKSPFPQHSFFSEFGEWLRSFHQLSRSIPAKRYNEAQGTSAFASEILKNSTRLGLPESRIDVALGWCHSDLHPGNIITTPDGRFAGVIDWEFARFGATQMDVAEVLWHFFLAQGPSPEKRSASHTFMDSYGVEPESRSSYLAWILSLTEARIRYFSSLPVREAGIYAEALADARRMKRRLVESPRELRHWLS